MKCNQLDFCETLLGKPGHLKMAIATKTTQNASMVERKKIENW